MGSLFIYVNVTLAYHRKKKVTTNFRKLLEATFFAFLTASAFYSIVLARSDNCYPSGEATSAEIEKEEVRFTCLEGYYNPLATLVFNTEGGTIRQFLRYPLLIQQDPDTN